MKSVLDKTTRDELINRINKLDENSEALWGQMNIYQMLKHCVLCEELYLGKSNTNGHLWEGYLVKLV